VQQIVRTADGKTRIVYQNGDDQIADWSLPAKTKYENLGNKLVLVDEDTGKPVLNADGKPQELKVNMSPAQAANYGLAERRFAFDRSRPVGGGSEPSYRILNTDNGYVAIDPKNPTRSFSIGLKAPKAASGYQPAPPPPASGGKKY
jgi:hypothetical protein